ncbi:methionine ABC transporter permease [Paenibacillus sp. CAU 1782]
MIQAIEKYHTQMWDAIGETFVMVGISTLAALLLGLPLGTLLYLSRRGQRYQNVWLFGVFNGLVNVIRSFPFLLFVVFMIPVTRWIVGTSLGTLAASVPLAFMATVYYSRLVEQALLDIPRGIIESAVSMGATKLQLIVKFLYVEARSGLVVAMTTSIISFISYSTVMGIVGGGGIGDFAIRYGYQRYETAIMIVTIVIMIILVQAIQFTGNWISRRIDKR